MTYGDVSSTLRRHMAELLTIHQPSTALGSRRNRDRPSEAQLREQSQLIQRYRAHVLRWLATTAEEAVPSEVSSTLDPLWGPARLLTNRLDATVARNAEVTPATAEDFTRGARDEPAILDLWREAASTALVSRGRDELADLGPATSPAGRAERLAVLDDVAMMTRALIVLDDRHRHLPGWTPLGSTYRAGTYSPGLMRAAHLCRDWTSAQPRDVEQADRRGWRPPLTITPGPVRPGTRGAVEALQNSVVELRDRPSARTYKLLLRSHYDMSRQVARLARGAGDDALAERFTRRATDYRDLVLATRNIDGTTGSTDRLADVVHRPASDRVLGPGGIALRDAEQARYLLSAAETATPDDLRALGALLATTDQRMAYHLEEGLRSATYVQTVGGKLEASGHGGVRRARAVYEPVTAATRPDLAELRARLRASPDVEQARHSLVLPEHARESARDALDRITEEHAHPRAGEALLARQRAAVSGHRPVPEVPGVAAQRRLGAQFPDEAAAKAYEEYVARTPTRSHHRRPERQEPEPGREVTRER